MGRNQAGTRILRTHLPNGADARAALVGRGQAAIQRVVHAEERDLGLDHRIMLRVVAEGVGEFFPILRSESAPKEKSSF